MFWIKAVSSIVLTVSAVGLSHASSQLCTGLIDAIRSPQTERQELMADARRSFRSLYDECDRTDLFAGAALPFFNGKAESCRIDPNRALAVQRLAKGPIYFNSKAAVDADGAPVSCGSQRSATDQCQTWLRYDTGPEKYVNSEQVPYIVIPSDGPHARHSFERASGVTAGDLAVVIHKQRCVYAIVADSGPYYRLGEASIALHEALGNPQCASKTTPCPRLIANGMGIGIPAGVDFLIFPHSRPSQLSADNILQKIQSETHRQVVRFLQ
jgi:Fungal chitosanase of glycosyl hydrolase group 75